jgi:hypothetical protein
MATLWFHMIGNDIYTYFDSLEEAYFYGSKFSKNSISYLKIIEHLYTHSTAVICYYNTFQLVIFHGKNKPFSKEYFFPHGIEFLEKENIKNKFDFSFY